MIWPYLRTGSPTAISARRDLVSQADRSRTSIAAAPDARQTRAESAEPRPPRCRRFSVRVLEPKRQPLPKTLSQAPSVRRLSSASVVDRERVESCNVGTTGYRLRTMAPRDDHRKSNDCEAIAG